MNDKTTVLPTFDRAGSPHTAPPMPGPAGDPTDHGPRNRSLIIAAVAAVALVVVLAGLLLATRRTDVTLASANGNATGTPSPGAPTETPSNVDISLPGAQTPTTNGSGAQPASEAPKAGGKAAPASTVVAPKTGGQTGTPNQGGAAPTTAPQSPSTPAPVITSFNAPSSIDCHNGNFQTFTLSWSTTNATKTTISIDGPGVYKTYGPSASDSMPFNCSSAHSFQLTAYAHDGRTVTRTITLQPRNVQTPSNDDDETNPPGTMPAKAPSSGTGDGH